MIDPKSVPASVLRCMHREPALRQPGQDRPALPARASCSASDGAGKGGDVPEPPAQDTGAGQQIAVFIPCLIPTATSQQKGAFAAPGGGVRFFKKKKVRESERTFHALLAPFAPETPFTGPLCLILTLTFPWRKSERKGRMAKFSAYPIETRPDCSNLIKTIEDVMTTLRFWNDDSQVSSLHISKRYGDKPGITLSLVSDKAQDKAGQLVSC